MRLHKVLKNVLSNRISIHALTRSATSNSPSETVVDFYFNPRTHEECDCYLIPFKNKKKDFNPRTHEECDGTGAVETWYIGDFNPRTHEECDHILMNNFKFTIYFNPRTHEECDVKSSDSARPRNGFQSTHSRGVRLPTVFTSNLPIGISIHALTRSATRPFLHRTCQSEFQSTHSRGVRPDRFYIELAN